MQDTRTTTTDGMATQNTDTEHSAGTGYSVLGSVLGTRSGPRNFHCGSPSLARIAAKGWM
jgi:hypothetical protein